MQILGVSLPHIPELDRQGLADFVRFLEAEGYGGFFSTEASAQDIFTVLGAAAAVSTRLRLGAAIQPIYTRTPTVAAQSWTTLDRISDGRALVGLGVSSPAIVERWNGLELKQPLRAMREYVEILRAIFAGGKIDYAGDVYRIDGFRPGLMPVQPQPPIFLAALNAKMLRLCGELADGVLMNLLPPAAVPGSITEVEHGITHAGRRRKDVHISAVLRVCMIEDREAADQSARMQLVGYIMAPQYRSMFTRHGFGQECDRVHERWHSGDRAGALGAISHHMIDELFAIGSRDKVIADIRRLYESGLDSVQLQPFAPPGHPDPWRHVKATLKAIAEAR